MAHVGKNPVRLCIERISEVTIKDFRAEIVDEVGTILSSDFQVVTTATSAVPHSGDGAITFPNLDAKFQRCKIINTCVLYIDIRRSTELSISHKASTVAKLYSAFIRAMTKCARRHGGHVRGIIGDRLMVIFDSPNCFTEAVDTAILMNSTAQYVLNKYFTRGEFECGIGIDAGQMLATKTGFRRRGMEQHNYKSLVWLGRPANVASKLTDVANKPAQGITVDKVCVGYKSYFSKDWVWRNEWPTDFLRNVTPGPFPSLTHASASYRHHFMVDEYIETTPSTPPILMTQPVYQGFKAARPNADSIKNGWFRQIAVTVPGYAGAVYGGDVIFTDFRN